MKLGTIDRIALLSVLPGEGDFLTLATAQDITKRVEFSAEEREALGLKAVETGGLTWDADKERESEVTFSDAERKVVVEALTDLDKRRKLKTDHLGLYRKFIMEPA